MKRPKRIRFIIKDQTHYVAVFIQAGGLYLDGIKWMEKAIGEAIEGEIEQSNRQGRMLAKDREVFVWFKDTKPPASIVAHEALHVVFHVMNRQLDCKLEENTEEPYAYYLGSLVKQIGGYLW